MKLIIGWLYSKSMNLYGDRGNIIAFCYRCKKRGIDIEVKNIEVGDRFNADEIDLAFFGGGQDKEQILVAEDLNNKAKEIKKFYETGKPMLAICGGYQLLGKYFKTNEGKKIDGIGIFDVYTIGGDKRMIGNVVIDAPVIGGKIVGFENHSGKTYFDMKNQQGIASSLSAALARPTPAVSDNSLKNGRGTGPSRNINPNTQIALGKVIKGYGNNGEDKTEGMISNNFIGTYLHGPILPKNPKLADWFLEKALEIKYNKPVKLDKLNDELEDKAREIILKKY